MHFSIPETVDRKDPKGSTYTVRHFFKILKNTPKIFMIIFYKEKKQLEKVNGVSMINFYSLFRSEKNVNNLESWLSESNHGIAIAASVFRLFK